ncbi:MAG TPA: hypothetical protein VHL59_07155, partial [Thermoanaerobaculia bacterium]|nr:hypothetical protein [Thermoanaerobaculia bacterium]
MSVSHDGSFSFFAFQSTKSRADSYPRATEYIPQMVDLVKQLEARGHTYVAEGSTYFRVATLPGYGKLSRV